MHYYLCSGYLHSLLLHYEVMSKDALLRLKEALLFKTLMIKDEKENRDSLLSSKVMEIVTSVSPLLERISENMPEYTLHDPNHSAKVLEIMGKIIPDETLHNFNSIELTLLILSCYLHDIGMTCSKEEKEQLIRTQEFEILFKSDIDKQNKFQYYISIKDHRSATFIEDQVFTEYLRRNHVRRSANYIAKHLNQGRLELSYNEIPFWKHLIAICDGHGEPVKSLENTSKWPRHTLVGDKIINVQFLSLVLRLADILDLDPERTPKIIYEFVNPKDPVSIIEWKKHRSIIGHSISKDRILFEAECSSPEVERALKQFMQWIEIERKETITLLEKYNDDISKKYFFNLIEPIPLDRIRSDSTYLSSDLKFEIDYKRVLDILMGQRLYKNPTIALREFLQNSIDAIKLRLAIYLNRSESFTPKIIIDINEDTLSIIDNGIGMDEYIFSNFFLQVGRSYYSSPVFFGRYSDVDVTSEFGIGVLSAFMIADSIIVESRREPENPLNPPQPILFEIPTAYSYTVQRKTERIDIGTTILLKLKGDHPFKRYKLKNILSELMPITPVKVYAKTREEDLVYEGLEPFKINKLIVSDLNNIKSLKNYLIENYMVESGEFTHKIIDVDFTAEDDPILINIKGQLSIINTNIINFYPTIAGYIAQRNFKVGNPSENENGDVFSIDITENLRNLLPDWTSFYCELNLTKDACLTLTPDRTDVIIDPKYKTLKTKLELKIIREFTTLFEDILSEYSSEKLYQFTDFLIGTGFIGRSLARNDSFYSTEAEKFLKKYLHLPVLDHNGTIRRRSMEEISMSHTIGLVKQTSIADNLDKLIQEITDQEICVIFLSEMEYGSGTRAIDGLISGLLGNKDKLGEPHTILTSCLPDFEIEIIKRRNSFRTCEDVNSYNSITNSLNSSYDQILFIFRSSLELYPVFNISHRVILPLFDEHGKFRNVNAPDLLLSIRNDIYDLLSKTMNKLVRTNKDFSMEVISYGVTNWDKNFFKLSANIFNREPELIEKLREVLSKYWRKAIELKIVDETSVMPTVTENDFLTYWYS